MPRIYTSESNPIDFCKHHMPQEVTARKRYANLGEGPDGRGNCFAYDAEHPPYEGEGYKCHRCKRQLTKHDN